MRTRLSLFALLMFSVFFCVSCQARSEVAPEWSLKDLNGKTVKLSDFKGQVVVLNFWATYCPPCILELPDFIAVQKEFQGKGVVIIGLSTDPVQPSEVAAFARKKNMNYPIVMVTDEVGDKYGVEIIPMTVIVGPDGKIADRQVGAVTQKYLEDHIRKLLPAH